MNPVISVIIPAYNCARFLPEAIESALTQTYPAVEVVVVNDGSPDNTAEVVQSYLDRIVYIQQENRGLSAARNVGFRVSHGDYVCFLDADDALLPGKFETQVAVLQREPAAGIVISGYVHVTEDGRVINTAQKAWHYDALDRLLDHESFAPHAAVIRRSVFEASAGFPEDIDTAESQEDWQLWLDLALNGVQFTSVNVATCLYRVRAGSIRTNPVKHLDGARRVVNWLRSDPRTVTMRDRVEQLAAIIELERVAAAWRMEWPEMADAELQAAVRQYPALWHKPLSYLRLFRQTLTALEAAQWQRQPDPAWFERRLINGVLKQGTANLSPADRKPMLAAAYLMLSDVAYSTQNDVVRRKAVWQAMKHTLAVCASNAGRASWLRGLIGPQAVSRMKRWFGNRRVAA